LPRLLVFRASLARQTVDFVIGEIIVLVLDERNLVVVGRLKIVFLGEIDADVVGGRWRCGVNLFGVVVAYQRRIVDDRVELGGFIGLGLESVLGISRRDDFFFLGVFLRHNRASADAAIAQRFLGIEFGSAFGADGRTPSQIVELRRTGWANLFGAQFGIGQFGDLNLLAGLEGRSLAMAGGHCQKPSPFSQPTKRVRMTDTAQAPTAAAPTQLTSHTAGPLRGAVTAPGDKSISHRALILGALARGVTEIEGLLEGEDVRRTAAAMAAFGAAVEHLGPGRWRVEGQGRFIEPADIIDCGNAGTGARLIMGAAASFSLSATFTGDRSLRGRPMGRLLTPLGLMGAQWLGRAGNRLPLTLRGGDLKGIDYPLPVPSAQVKSAVLLAGLNAEGRTRVIEPEPTRDHTEHMLRAFGAEVSVDTTASGRVISLRGGQRLTGAAIRVPGDPSSAAFPVVAALITPGSEVTIGNVLLNPLRSGLFETLKEMGADIEIANSRHAGGERVGDIVARHSTLRGVVVPETRAASMIDEYPILAIAAAFADGPTIMRGLGELRVKESDRLALMAAGLTACGVHVEEEPEGLVVIGTGGANHPVAGGATAVTHGDHRIAMSFLVLGLAAKSPVTVDEADMIATSFPGFMALMAQLGARIDAA
jgi:3-phosphoshikimate 1-carboxyvinyltransferase